MIRSNLTNQKMFKFAKFRRWVKNFKRIFLGWKWNNNNTLLFRSLQHLTRARVFHGLEIVYCFSASFLLLLLLTLSFVVCFSSHQTFSYSRPLHLHNMLERHRAMPLDCFLMPFHIPLWAFYATVFRLLRLFYNYKFMVERDKANKMDDVLAVHGE